MKDSVSHHDNILHLEYHYYVNDRCILHQHVDHDDHDDHASVSTLYAYIIKINSDSNI